MKFFMADAPDEHRGTVGINGRTITNLQFADDMHCGYSCWQRERTRSYSRYEKNSITQGIEISADKTKLMTNNTSGISTDIRVSGVKLQAVSAFKYLGIVATDEV